MPAFGIPGLYFEPREPDMPPPPIHNPFEFFHAQVDIKHQIPKNQSVLEYSKQLLKQEIKPMTSKMIYNYIVENNYNPFTTKTPEASIHTTLSRNKDIIKIRLYDDLGKFRDHFKIN